MLQRCEALCVTQCAELLSEAVYVTEYPVVDEAHQAVQLQQRVLQRRGGEEHLARVGECIPKGAGGLVVGLVDIAEAVCFVNDHEIPRHCSQVSGLRRCELIGADDDLARAAVPGGTHLEGVRLPVFRGLPV